MSKNIQTINPPGCPPAIGPYSVAKVFNGIGYVSGQIPLTQKGELVEGPIEEQTHQVLKNMGAILKGLNCKYEDVLKVSIFLADMEDFKKVNEIYGEYFKVDPPARYCVAVKGLPRNCRVEMDMTVAVGASL